jgi:3-phenylpropionate/trans-cinnamate dioxygenase ferredoxin component
MPTFINSEQMSRLQRGAGVVVTIGNNTVALFSIGGQVRAVEDGCMHCAASLAGASIDNGIIACHHCDWRYDVATGAVVGLPALRLRTFDVSISSSQVTIADA